MAKHEDRATILARGRHKRWAPRSKTGCLACKKRKIKCDEVKPECSRCIRAGMKCPGYSLESSPSAVVCSIPSAPPSLAQFSGSSEMRDVLFLLPSINKSKPVPKDDICRGMRTGVEVVLQDLPSRIGHSVALDTAVMCAATLLKEVSLQLSTSTVDILEANQITLKMRNSYSVALSALHIALSHPLHSTTIETLYAVQLLCCFESFQYSHSDRVVSHLFGISKIVEHRGPQRFKTKPERDMLFRQLPAITWSSLQYNIPNFLCRAGWEAIIKPVEYSSTDQSRVELGVHRNAAHVITLLAECSSLIKNSRDGKEHTVWHISLLQKVKHTRRKVMKWHRRLLEDLSPIDAPHDTVSVLEQLYRKPSALDVYLDLSSCQIFCNLILRLPVALGCDNASEVEQQTLKHAQDLKDLYAKIAKENPEFPEPCLEMYNIDATLSTTEEWQKFAAEADNGRQEDRLRLIPEHLFKGWLDAMEIEY